MINYSEIINFIKGEAALDQLAVQLLGKIKTIYYTENNTDEVLTIYITCEESDQLLMMSINVKNMAFKSISEDLKLQRKGEILIGLLITKARSRNLEQK